MIRVLFFGALREKIGCANLNLPMTQETDYRVADVLHQLSQLSEQNAKALFDSQLICAVNQHICSLQQQVQAGDEIAFFPPVTGG